MKKVLSILLFVGKVVKAKYCCHDVTLFATAVFAEAFGFWKLVNKRVM